MRLSHTYFQSLSSAEAMDVERDMSERIIMAYVLGVNVILDNYDKPLHETFAAHGEAMRSLGFNMSDVELMQKFSYRIKGREI